MDDDLFERADDLRQARRDNGDDLKAEVFAYEDDGYQARCSNPSHAPWSGGIYHVVVSGREMAAHFSAAADARLHNTTVHRLA